MCLCIHQSVSLMEIGAPTLGSYKKSPLGVYLFSTAPEVPCLPAKGQGPRCLTYLILLDDNSLLQALKCCFIGSGWVIQDRIGSVNRSMVMVVDGSRAI